MTEPETITITTVEYLKLVESDLTLAALEAAGVDNWEGHGTIDWAAVKAAVAGVAEDVGEVA